MVQDKIRLGFFKRGRMVFISHLDIIRTITGAMGRAGIPIYYSEGFNPHPKMVFALALPLGCSSDCEYLDIRLTRPMDENELLTKLNRQFPPDMQFTKCYERNGFDDFLSIEAAEYTITICEKIPSADIERALNGSILTEKKSKKGIVSVDMQSFILKKSVNNDENGNTVINVLLLSKQDACANPVHLVAGLGSLLGVRIDDWYINRNKIFIRDGKEFQ